MTSHLKLLDLPAGDVFNDLQCWQLGRDFAEEHLHEPESVLNRDYGAIAAYLCRFLVVCPIDNDLLRLPWFQLFLGVDG